MDASSNAKFSMTHGFIPPFPKKITSGLTTSKRGAFLLVFHSLLQLLTPIAIIDIAPNAFITYVLMRFSVNAIDEFISSWTLSPPGLSEMVSTPHCPINDLS